MDRPLRENCKEFGMEKFLALLLASLLLAGCHMKPTAEQERQSAEVARQNTAEQERQSAEVARQNDEAARNRQAEEAAKKLREEFGDEISSQVINFQQGLAGNPPTAIGWKFTNSRMFINRNTGVLTIELHCQFSDTVGNYNVRSDSPDYSTQYLPLLVRLFDDNGQYLTHFETSEIYGKSVMNRNSDHNVGGHYMKELQDRTVVQYSINKRDAAFVQIGEVGQVSH
jgi:nucleoid-associated protein YgaU